MGAAAAQVGRHVAADRFIVWIRVGLQQRLCPYDHSRDAITTLGGLFVDKGFLQRPRLVGAAQALHGAHRFARQRAARRQAGKHRFVVH